MLHMSEKSDRMPESIAAILGDAAGQADGLGKSGAYRKWLRMRCRMDGTGC